MSMRRDNPPSEWSNATRIADSDVYISPADPPSDTAIVWHWCPTAKCWEGHYIRHATSTDPHQLTPSLLCTACQEAAPASDIADARTAAQEATRP